MAWQPPHKKHNYDTTSHGTAQTRADISEKLTVAYIPPAILLSRGDGLDFEAGALGDSGDLDAGAGGERRMEGAGVGVVHGGEVREVGEEHGRGMSLRNV